MNQLASLAIVISLAVAGCAGEDAPPPRYTGTMHVAQVTSAISGTNSGSIFGLITIPEELTPTSTAGGCDYVGSHPSAGITMGPLTVTGANEPSVVEPSSFIDGELYLGGFEATPLAADTPLTATVGDAALNVVVTATMPARLTATLPPSISLTGGATITWTAGTADEIELELQLTGLGTEQYLRCRTTDTGSFTIPPAALAQLSLESNPQALLLIARRNLGTTVSESMDVEMSLAVESQIFAGVTFTP